MLERLVASGQSPGVLGSRGAAFSVTVHGLMIAGAVLATRPGSDLPSSPAPTDTIPIFYPGPPEPDAPANPDHDWLPPFPMVDRDLLDGVSEVSAITFDRVPNGIPAPDARVVWPSGRVGTGRETAWPWARPGGTDPSAPIHATVADEPPVLLTSPPPVYPAMLRQAGIEGSVVVEIVVDEEGRPEAGSARVVSSAHPMFEAAARRVVLAARYRPGRWHGRAVRVLIRQPVEFRLSGG